MNERGIDTSSPEGIRLSGEPSKRTNYNPRMRRSPWTQKKNCRIPDILLHCPRHDDLQVFALEAKRARKTLTGSITNQEEIIDDLVALSEYIQGLGYWYRFFIGLGFNSNSLRGIFESIQTPLREQISSVAEKTTVFAMQDGERGDDFPRECIRFRLSNCFQDSP